MNKERVGCNGCEAVSTQNEGGEGVPASRNNKLEVTRHSRFARIATTKRTDEAIASLFTLNPKASDTTAES